MRNDEDLCEMINFLKNDPIKDVREIIDQIKEISEKMDLEETPNFEKIGAVKENDHNFERILFEEASDQFV